MIRAFQNWMSLMNIQNWMEFRHPKLDESLNIQNWVIRVFQNWMTLRLPILEDTNHPILDALKNHPILDAENTIQFWMLIYVFQFWKTRIIQFWMFKKSSYSG